MNIIKSIATTTIVLATFVSSTTIAQTTPTPTPTPTPNSAPTPAQIAQHCIHQIAHTADRTIDSIHSTEAATKRFIRAIDDAGASDNRIIHAGRQGSQKADDRAQAGSRRITTIANNCVRLLNEIESPPRFIAAVVSAKRRAIAAIDTTLIHAKASIARAVFIATNN